jgi:alpha-D-ribose 1-methylphosphonate 5-triphosphate synthase subunit PhnH
VTAPEIEAAVFGSQRAFRVLLQATARPGEPADLLVARGAALKTVLLALLDHEVTFAVVGEREDEYGALLESRLADETNARVASVPEADFLVVVGGKSLGALLEARRGTLEEPSEGATAIYPVVGLATEGPVPAPGLELLLSGPGVRRETTLFVEGLARSEAGAIVESRAGYPLGVDVYLVDGDGLVVGLPRSTRVEAIS